MEKFTTLYHTPLGWLRLSCTDTALLSATFIEEVKEYPALSDHPVLQACIQQLDDYFKGKTKEFNLPLQQEGTAFQQKVWDLLTGIPFGKTLSYLELSKQYGDVKAIRAVGAANGRNNIAIIIPCHRVIGANQKLVGYAGGLWRKQWLLAHEAKHTFGVQRLF